MDGELKKIIKIGSFIAFLFILLCFGVYFLFQKNVEVVLNTYTLEAGEKVIVTDLVKRIDGIEIEASNRISNNTIHLENIDIHISDIDTSKLGEQSIVFSFSDESLKSISKTVVVKDTKAPVIEWQKEMNDEIELEEINCPVAFFDVSDSFDPFNKVHIETHFDRDEYKQGDICILSVHCEDSSGNFSDSSIQLKIRQSEKSDTDNKAKNKSEGAEKKENDSTYSDQHLETEKNTYIPESSSNGSSQAGQNYTPPVVTQPACSAVFYASDYGENLISAYNAAQRYFDSCTGTASMYPVNDSTGETIGWGIK